MSAARWYFDFVSPFSYLQLRKVLQWRSQLEIEPVPIAFGAVLKACGQLGPAEIPCKREFTYRFVQWQAEQAGASLRFPPQHPFNPLAALRLIIVAGCDRRAAGAVLDAVFRDGRDVSDPAVIADLAQRLGVRDPQSALADPAVKQRLRDNTSWAAARGVFGVPTLLIGEELFWGDDAFDMALDYLTRPERFRDPAMQAVETLPVGAARQRQQ